ncbi:histidine kinase [Nonomuraea sp. NPDC052634]|uniref:sensor histidine kinase n=1 Tax=Nonomuraea sp. NPDC052634 TaxID=3155813 RepID=UPI00341FF918
MGAEWTYGLVAIVVVLLAAALALGAALVRAHRRYRAVVEERGRMLERESARAARAAVDAERARIARELHDIVSHNVSLMVVQASAAREVMTVQPEECAEALKEVENAGRSAMSELRHLLGLLAPSPDGTDEPAGPAEPAGAGLAPSPDLSGLDRLIDRFAFAGLNVESRILGEPRPLPPGIGATVYRIVQEALTNALKHAEPDTKAEVTIRYAGNHVRVEVLNTGPSVLTSDGTSAPMERRAGGPPVPGERRDEASPVPGERRDDASPVLRERRAGGAGRGLLGLRERVAVYGGHLDARRRLGGGYRVRARIPLPPPDPPDPSGPTGTAAGPSSTPDAVPRAADPSGPLAGDPPRPPEPSPSDPGSRLRQGGR